MSMKNIPLLVCLLVTVFVFSARAADAPLRVGDTFDLRIGGVPPDDVIAINSSYTIDGTGGLNLPYIGKITVAGMTSSQIQALIERTYVDRGIYTHPTITLAIAQTARFVNVGGHVKAPQRVTYTPDMTVLSAINAAGDFDDFANQKQVRLIRGKTVTIINCKEIRRDPSQDVAVLPGDQIQVPESMF
jgi:protein involved in polysaccharide export with SLBB domain